MGLWRSEAGTDADAARQAVAYLHESAAVQRRTGEACADQVVHAANIIAKAMGSGRKLLLCGNGGSAADCQHVAAEFVSRLTREVVRPALPAIALTTDTSFLTAYANDCDFEGVFMRQVEALGTPGDVLLGISTSGSSKNVRRAVQTAREMGLSTIALIGEGGSLASEVDCAIVIPSGDTQHIQEAMLPVEHFICHLVERTLFPIHGSDLQPQV